MIKYKVKCANFLTVVYIRISISVTLSGDRVEKVTIFNIVSIKVELVPVESVAVWCENQKINIINPISKAHEIYFLKLVKDFHFLCYI